MKINTHRHFKLPALTLVCIALSNAAYSQQAAVPAAQQDQTDDAASRSVPSSRTENETTLPTVTVTGTIESDGDYRPSEQVTSTTKSATPLLKMPFSVQVVPEALIKDRQSNTLRETVETVSGVFAGSTSLHEDLIVRGFQNLNSYRNGVRTRRLGITETANAERVDVLKGPVSVLFGRGDVGGLFNVVTKKPLDEDYYSLQQQFGSADFFSQSTLDATGPLEASKTLLYRVNASYEHSDSFRDFIDGDRWFVAPTVSFRPSDRFRIDFEFEYANDYRPIDRWNVALGDRPANVPRERNFGEPFAHHRNEVALGAFNWNWQFSDNWLLRQNFLYEQGRGQGLEYLQQLLEDDVTLASDGTLGRLPRRIERRDIDTLYTSLELAGHPEWLGFKQDIVLGFDFRDSEGNFDFRVGDFDTINIFNPVHVATEPSTPFLDLLTHNDIQDYGVYGQDQITLLDPLQLLLGGRYDNSQSRSRDFNNPAETTNDEKFSPRAGLVLSPQSFWSLYATYTESFSSTNFGLSRTGALKPETGIQYEVGAKAETPDKGLFTTLALYDLTKSNITATDPNDTRFSVQIGKARSRGIEWDIGGRVTPNLNLTASYAYTDTEITQAAVDGNQGNELYGVPRHAGKGFVRYDLKEGGETGMSFGGGVAMLGEQWGDNENTFRIPGYVRVDLMARYRWRFAGTRMTAQVNANNITDKTYYLPSGSRSEVAFGAPATVLASFRVEY